MVRFFKKNFDTIFLLVVAGLLYTIKTVLTPFFIGITAAYLSLPIMSFLQRKLKCPKSIASIISVIITYSGLVAIVLLTAPFFYDRISEIMQSVISLKHQTAKIEVNQDWQRILTNIEDSIINKIPVYVTSIVNTLMSSTQAALSLMFNVIFAPMISIYFLQDIYPKRTKHSIGKYLSNISESFIRTQMIMISVYSLYYCTLLSLLQIKENITLGCICGILYVIPYFGPIVGLSLCSLVTFAQYGVDHHLALLAAGFISISILDIVLISPKFIGPKFGLHPLMTIFSLLVSTHLFGGIGTVLAIPIGVIIKDLLYLIVSSSKA